MTHRIAVVAFDGISMFHLSVPRLVFGADHFGTAGYELTVCAVEPGSLATSAGVPISVTEDLGAFESADTVVIPSWADRLEVPDELLDALRAAHRRGARIVGLCYGAHVIAAAGVADGREVTTHWDAAERLSRRYPAVQVRSDVLWTDLGDVITSAGTVASLDCCLHLVRHDHGATIAATVARHLVMAPHRDGSQAQFIAAPVSDNGSDDPIDAAMIWADLHLAETFDLDDWATHARVSRRTFTRRFRARTGESPGGWLLARRLDRARILLEGTDLSIDDVATSAGFGSAVALRSHFRIAFGTTPTRHRQQFAGVGAAVGTTLPSSPRD
ncbi:GlxA family transcriptional regulator [Gordonia soli]|uniref:GlxA family transcriptional regulator n=1 Tax=Gordonia soli TaxID=320799 RepID=UPI00058B9A99|nr:helix-turn-helix domain-containing protein [Gordonia soli]